MQFILVDIADAWVLVRVPRNAGDADLSALRDEIEIETGFMTRGVLTTISMRDLKRLGGK